MISHLIIFIILTLSFDVSCSSDIFNSNFSDKEFFGKLCKNHSIPIIKIKGRNDDVIKLVFTGDTQFARNIEKQMKKDKTSYSVLYS